MARCCKYYKLTGKRNSYGAEYIQCTSPTCSLGSLRSGTGYNVSSSITKFCFNGAIGTEVKGKIFGKKETVPMRCPYYCGQVEFKNRIACN